MENLEGQELAVAVAVGGAMMFAAFKFLSGMVGATEETKKTQTSKPQVAKKSKSSKKKQPKKKKAGKTEKTEIEEVKSSKKVTIETDSKPKKKSTTKKKVAEPAEPVVTEEPKKKKKKRNKKKKKVVEELEDSDLSDYDLPGVPRQTVKKQQAKEDSKRASDFVTDQKTEADQDAGWETVPVKPRKAKSERNFEEDQFSDGGKKTKARDKKETISIGDHVAVILGEGGATISNIQNVSGARVSINKESKTCTITGDEESVAVAKQLVVSLISNQSKHTISVSSRLDKAILGKSDTKQAIRDLSGAKIEYAFGKDKDDSMTVVITGEVDKVEHAKQLVESYLEGKTPEGGEGVKRVKVTGFQGRILIGQKGAQISQLQRESGASINVEFLEGDNLAVVSVIGDEDQISSGLDLIQQFLTEHNVKAKVDLDSDARGVLQKLNTLRKEIPNLQIDVTDDRSQILLCGSAQGVTQGSEMLLSWIDRELGPPETRPGEIMEAIDLGGAAGKVIGKNRTTLNHILANSGGAKIDLKRGSLCYIYGQPGPVAKAVKAVKDILGKHQDVIAKSQQEKEELQAASWVVLGAEEESRLAVTARNKNAVAPEADWGGFKLAQIQGW